MRTPSVPTTSTREVQAAVQASLGWSGSTTRTVLERMVKLGSVSPADAAAAKEQPITLNPKRRLTVQENYAMDMVMRELDVLLDDEQQDQGGLKIYTTIDPVLQDEAQQALDRALATRGRFQLIEAMIPRGVLSKTLERYVAGVKRLTER